MRLWGFEKRASPPPTRHMSITLLFWRPTAGPPPPQQLSPEWALREEGDMEWRLEMPNLDGRPRTEGLRDLEAGHSYRRALAAACAHLIRSMMTGISREWRVKGVGF